MKIPHSGLKKAQAASEFLFTYGWAVLVVALVLIGLAWMGVFNITSQVPDSCSFPLQTLDCKDARVSSGQSTISIIGPGGPETVVTPFTILESITVQNKFGKSIRLCDITCSAEPPNAYTGLPGTMSNLRADCKGSGGSIHVPVINKDRLLPEEQATISSSVVPGIECLDAAGRTGGYSVNTKYAGKVYIQYSFDGDSPIEAARILMGDIVATVQSGK
ncbi:Uncharacterised protein [Candidatus Burarchaeum australiense]|nr:Uncharacterised protein [Candidatus Burarchaeum australiense]